ncbi:MAG: hypothetical protein K9L32_01895 [Chromatiaceae bacterium]|nr:hypothetical protein [Chromatiaceae bacterium]
MTKTSKVVGLIGLDLEPELHTGYVRFPEKSGRVNNDSEVSRSIAHLAIQRTDGHPTLGNRDMQ